jgi:hypothetical protein
MWKGREKGGRSRAQERVNMTKEGRKVKGGGRWSSERRRGRGSENFKKENSKKFQANLHATYI